MFLQRRHYLKTNLLTSINNLLENKEFTKGYQDKNHEYFMDYVHPESGEDIPIYLSEYKEVGHVRRRFLERFTNPNKEFKNWTTGDVITAKNYMEKNHPSGKYKKLIWPDDFEKFMEIALDYVAEKYNMKRSKYIVDFSYYGLLIPFAIYSFNNGGLFVVVRTLRHAMFDTVPDNDKFNHKDNRFIIFKESSLYNINMILDEGFEVYDNKSNVPIIIIKKCLE